MKILAYSLGSLKTNCYFLIQDSECIIIDPADDASFILEELLRKNLKLICMFATHGHYDHVMAAGEIQLSFNVPFYIHEKDMFLVDRLVETAHHFLGYNSHVIKPSNIKFINITNEFQINNFKFQILHSPGHTPGSCCIYIKEEGVLLTGDTLFNQGIGDYLHSYSSKTELIKSLKKLKKLPGETLAYPGHGDETILEEEKL